MKITPKHGYILFGLSFICPNLTLDMIGINLAVDSVLGGVGGLLDGLSRIPSSIYGLSLFALNFSIMPGVEIKNGLRKLIAIWPWTLLGFSFFGFGGIGFILAISPPFLIWAASISLINILEIKTQQNQADLTTPEDAPASS